MEKIRAALAWARACTVRATAWARANKAVCTAVAAGVAAVLSKVWPTFPADEVLRALATLLAA